MNADEGLLFEPSLLDEIRARFCHVDSDPSEGPRIYLENAGGGFTLKKVVETVAYHASLPDNAGRPNAASRAIDWAIAEGKQDVGLLLGAQTGAIAIGESTTALAFRVLSAILLNVPGRNVVVTNLDHPAVYDSAYLLCERFGKERRIAPLSPATGRVDPESIAARVDRDTLALCFIHGSNITGGRNDAAAIIRAARDVKPDLVTVVDGAQQGSHIPVDVEAMGCDVYFLSSYKTFSKPGAAAAWLSGRVASLPHDRLLGKPATYWELGTREQGGYAAWSDVVEYLCWLGAHFTGETERRSQLRAAMEAVEQHERALLHHLLRGAGRAPGLLQMDHVTVYGEVADLMQRGPCVAFNVEGMPTAEVVAYLEKHHIRVGNRVSDAYSRHTLQALGIEECVRVSLAHYTAPAEVEAFLAALNKVSA